MLMKETVFVIVIAHILDRFLGDPVYPFHPVRLIGKAIEINVVMLIQCQIKKAFVTIILYR